MSFYSLCAAALLAKASSSDVCDGAGTCADEVKLLQGLITHRAAAVPTLPVFVVGTAMQNTKCPLNHEDRLFRTPRSGSSDVTIADCYKQCASTAGCNHFSYGAWQGGFVCQSCTKSDEAQTHEGFILYDMPPTPLAAVVGTAMQNTKCPLNHEDRLFRTPSSGSSDVTIVDCYEQCASTAGCKHFSYGAWQGAFVCQGCTESDEAQTHEGFTLYDMPPTLLVAVVGTAMQNTKCPLNHEDRLFRTPSSGSSDVTIEDCYEQCASTAGCNHFSYGAWQEAFVCQGCTESDEAQTHEGFTLYDMPPTLPVDLSLGMQ